MPPPASVSDLRPASVHPAKAQNQTGKIEPFELASPLALESGTKKKIKKHLVSL